MDRFWVLGSGVWGLESAGRRDKGDRVMSKRESGNLTFLSCVPNFKQEQPFRMGVQVIRDRSDRE